ncbi:unnamed protein product, partial [Choristocarpus tenellus]
LLSCAYGIVQVAERTASKCVEWLGGVGVSEYVTDFFLVARLGYIHFLCSASA